MKSKGKNWLATALILICLLPTLALAHKPYDQIVIFGDSLSDPGNAFILKGTALIPPYETLDALLIPDTPYAIGGHHFSNGATWIEQLASKLKLHTSAKSAVKDSQRRSVKRANYAVGSARARDNGSGADLQNQVSAYLANCQTGNSDRMLTVIVIGANDVRDAIAALSLDPSGAASAEILGAALTSISDNLLALYSQGAREILIGNAPDLSLTPAIRTLDLFSPGTAMAAAIITTQFNAGLDALISNLQSALPDLVIHSIDLSGKLQAIVANPDQYRLTNVTDGCIMPGIPPYSCSTPKRYLFWDGIHPTKAGHGIFAEFALEILVPDAAEEEKERHCHKPVWAAREGYLRTRHECRR